MQSMRRRRTNPSQADTTPRCGSHPSAPEAEGTRSMPIVDEEAFAGRPLARIFLTPRVKEARRVEAVLDQQGVDYCVRVEPCGSTLFGSTRQGAAFFVDETLADSCDEALVR